MSYRIRSVEKRDEDEWVELRHALYGDDVRVHADEVRRFFDGTASEPRAVLVAVDSGGNVLGFAEVSRLRCFRKALGDGLDQPTADA